MKYILSLIGLLLIVSCGSQNTKSPYSQIEYEVGPCFGFCPVYKIMIDDHRKVTLDAIRYNFSNDKNMSDKIPKHEGIFTRKITLEEYEKLVTLLNKAQLKTLKDKYTNKEIMDMSTVYLRVKFSDGSTKNIQDYGKRGPQELKEIYDFIQTLKDSKNWKEVE